MLRSDGCYPGPSSYLSRPLCPLVPLTGPQLRSAPAVAPDAVLKSHVKGYPNWYKRKVCNGQSNSLESFEACLDSHRFLSDGVLPVKDGYRMEENMSIK